MHFLVVGDSPANRGPILRQLRQHFATIQLTEAATHADFQAALVEGPFDLVVTDYELNWGDGLQVVREIKEHFPSTPVVMCTDSSNEQVAAEGMRMGLSDYVLKRRMEHLPAAVLSSLERAELRSKYEEAVRDLRLSEQRYRRVASAFVDYAYELQVEPSGQVSVQWRSGNLGKVTGCALSLLNRPGDRAAQVYPDDEAGVRKFIPHLLAGETITTEHRIVTPRGEVRWLRVVDQPVWDPNQSRVVRIYGGIRDVTTQRQASELLRQAKDELEARVAERTAELAQTQATAEQRANELGAVFAALIDAIAVFDQEGRLVHCNPAAAVLIGPDSDVEGPEEQERPLPFRTAGSEQDLSVHELPVSRALAGETVANERVVLTQVDGRESIQLVSAAPLWHDGEVVGAVAAAHDITELEQAHELSEALNQINMRLSSTLEVDPIMPGVIAQATEALRADVVALNRREGNGWLVHHIHGLPPEVAGRLYSDEEALIATVAAKRRDVVVVEDSAADGYLGPVAQAHGVRSFIAIPLLLKGETAGVIYFGYRRPHFITTAQLYFARQMAALISLALETGLLYKQARQDADTKATLLREVNHRVKNNLVAITGLLYTHLERPGIATSPEYQRLVRELAQRVDSLSVVHGMLSASQWSDLSLDELAARIVASSMQVAGPGWLKVEILASEVRVSPEQAHTLALVINELALNVAKHALRDQPCHVTLQATQEENEIVLAFHDDGPGYPAEVLTEDRVGVGLDLTRNLVRQNLRGRLVLRNEGGAVAEVHFPARREKQEIS